MSANIQTEAEFKPQEEQGVLQQMESPPPESVLGIVKSLWAYMKRQK